MYKNILVPISFDDDRDAAGAQKVAKILADADARITLIHVMEHIPAYAVTRMPVGYVQEARIAIDVELENMAAGQKNVHAVVVEGHSGRSLLEWADKNDVDCIVIASHRPGAADLILGSTAARVVRHANCSVHVVRS